MIHDLIRLLVDRMKSFPKNHRDRKTKTYTKTEIKKKQKKKRRMHTSQ